MKKFIASLFLFGFLLNFVWEVTQMPLYASTGMGTTDLVPFIWIHWQVSLGDALTILVAYLITSVIFRNKRWVTEKIIAPWVFFLSGLIVWQISVEYFAVYVWHRWAYSVLMPAVFGIGISPLLQILVLSPTAIFLSRKYLAE